MSQVLDMLIDTSDVESDDLGRELLSDARNDMHASWSKRYAWLKRAYGVQVTGNRRSQDLETLVDLRNALIHGNGQLTRVQTQRLPKALMLERKLRDVLSVDTQGHRLIVTSATGPAAVRIVRDFIITFDQAVQDRLSTIADSMEERASQ